MRGPNPGRRGPALLPLLAALVSSGCTAGMSTHLEESVVPPEPLPVTRLAIMPVTTAAGSETIRSGLADRLHEVLADRFPSLVILGPMETSRRLARSPAATEYADLLADYDRTGVVESARLARLTRALDVDHFLHVRAEYVREEILQPGLLARNVSREDRQEVALVAGLWGQEGPGPEWQAVVRTRSETNEVRMRSRDLDELVRQVVDAMARRVPLHARPGG